MAKKKQEVAAEVEQVAEAKPVQEKVEVWLAQYRYGVSGIWSTIAAHNGTTLSSDGGGAQEIVQWMRGRTANQFLEQLEYRLCRCELPIVEIVAVPPIKVER